MERERGSARSRRCLALFEIRCVVSEIAVGDGSVVAGFFFFFLESSQTGDDHPQEDLAKF